MHNTVPAELHKIEHQLTGPLTKEQVMSMYNNVFNGLSQFQKKYILNWTPVSVQSSVPHAMCP